MTLDLPEVDDRIAARCTVGMAICQVRFDQQPSVGSGPTALAFQEKLGGAEGLYPKIEEAEGANRLVMGIGPGRPIAETSRISGWNLSSTDEQWSIALLPGNMGLQSDKYDGWEDFRQRLATALEALRDIVGPSLEQRLGLRFVDVIPGKKLDMTSPADWERYISSEFLGASLSPAIGSAIRFSFQQAVIDLSDGVICNLRTGPGAPNDDGSVDFGIDCDLYREGGRPFDLATILSTVGTFKEQADAVIQSVLAPALFDKLDL